MLTRITHYIKAGYPCLYLVSHEEQRIERTIAEAASATQRLLFAWDIVKGRHEVAAGTIEMIDDPLAILESVQTMPENSLLLLRDFHLYLTTDFPAYAHLVRRFKDATIQAKARGITMLILAPEIKIPLDLTKLITPIEFSLPDREALTIVLRSIADSADLALPEDLTPILAAASGLTTSEAEDAFALSVVESGDIRPEIIQREKANTIRKNGILEIVDYPSTLDSVGGLENLKSWLTLNRHLYTEAAAEFGCEPPRGFLACGHPGTGKSLLSKACGNIFNLPLLRLEAGRLFGSLVGQSEQNWRTAHATAKAVAPCVLWIDEVDGLFSGTGSSSTDGGTSDRVIKAIIQDMQDHSEGIFYVFTANDIDKIPDPVIDRVKTWLVDLPHHEERLAIWRIQIAKLRRNQKVPWNPDNYDIQRLAEASEGYSGRQIELVWLAAIAAAHNDAKRPPTTEDVLAALGDSIPTSKTMGAAIQARRERLNGRATPASRPPAENQPKAARKILKAA
jgi:AAA+ superfamily predicted ATPase